MSRIAGFHHTETSKKKLSEAMRNRTRSKEYRLHISESKQADKNGMWVGDKASYQAIHTWLRKHHKKPSCCSYCGDSKKLDWASKTKEYTRNISEYVALCRGCHIKLDRYKSIVI